MPDLEVAPCLLGVPHGLPKSLQLGPHHRVRRLVRVDEVGPHPDDPDSALGLEAAGSVQKDRPVLAEGAVAAQAGVDLEVDAGGPSKGPSRVGHLGERPQGRNRQIDVGGDSGGEVRAGDVKP